MYREVTMIEVREVLRLRGAGLPKKRIAAQLGLDPKTVRRYLAAAMTARVRATATISDEEVRQVLLALHPAGGRPRGDGWARCLEQRAAIERWLRDGLRLTKIRKLLCRQGVEIAYPTLHRFAVLELQFGKTGTTIPVLDGEPGQELQLDTGWVGSLTLPERKRRRFRAWIFTAVRSRHRFVYPTFEETTARAIEACEAAWEFFGGVFNVIIPDNTKAIIVAADPLAPRITPAFLEYAQARHFHIDPARVRHARDKGRVERAVPGVRDDCFAGEVLTTLDDARAWGRHWCLNDYGLRRHSRTQRRPLEHSQAEEQAVLLPAPTTPYDIPLWSEPKVGRDQLAAVDKALYSIPHPYVGQWITARADAQIVRFYARGLLIKTHPRKAPGGQAIDASDYPVERSVYAMRNVDALRRQAEAASDVVGRYAAALAARVPSTGDYVVSLRYSNATGRSRTLSVYVNASKAKQTTLPPLSSWAEWSDKPEVLRLVAGQNRIAYRYDSEDSGNANLDSIRISTVQPVITWSCDAEARAAGPKVRSGTAGAAADYTISNEGQEPISVHWLDLDGKRRRRFDLRPGETRRQDSFLGHAWLVADSNGKCVVIFVPPLTIVIGRSG